MYQEAYAATAQMNSIFSLLVLTGYLTWSKNKAITENFVIDKTPGTVKPVQFHLASMLMKKLKPKGTGTPEKVATLVSRVEKMSFDAATIDMLFSLPTAK